MSERRDVNVSVCCFRSFSCDEDANTVALKSYYFNGWRVVAMAVDQGGVPTFVLERHTHAVTGELV